MSKQRLRLEDVDSLQFMIDELFTPSSPLKLLELFAGRQGQIHRLVRIIAEPGKHAVIFGEREVGMTSLIRQIEGVITAANTFPICINISCGPTDTFSSIWRKIFSNIRL